MTLPDLLTRVSENYEETNSVDGLWKEMPQITEAIRAEFESRLELRPEVHKITLILAELEPQLAFGTNLIIFMLHFPEHPGLKIRCECCLEHPAAKISIDKMPHDEQRISVSLRKITAGYIGATCESHLLHI